MTKYIAFLRGINVGGHKIIKMTELKSMFESFGFSNVKTYIQSGNVIFEDNESDEKSVTEKIENGLYKALGYEVKVIIRTSKEINDILAHNPFKVESEQKVKLYITFLTKKTEIKHQLPLLNEKEGYEITDIHNREIYSISYLMDNGSYGNPGIFIEKNYTKLSTTRNINTIEKIAKLL